MAISDFLSKITSSISGVTRENSQFRQMASQQNSSISKFIKDISKMFTSQSGQQSSINNSLNSLEQTTAQSSQKIDQTNSLLTQSISIQTSMLNELKNMKGSLEQLLGGTATGAGTGSSLAGNMVNMATGAAIGAGATAAATNMGGGGGQPSQNGSVEPGVGGSGSASEALKFFESKGWSKQQAAGIVGNLQAESGKNLDITSVGDGGKAYGIAQWHPDRQANFDRVFGKPIQSSSFAEQLEFIQWELENAENKAGNLLKQTQSAGEAAAIFDQYYERSSGEHRQKRISNAISLLEEKDDASAPQGTLVEKDSPTPGFTSGGGGAVQEKQAELAGVRKLPLSSKLKSVLDQAAAAAGVEAVVYSGGQAPKGSGGPRTGSTRHDNGNAADLYLMKDGRKLSDTNPGDKAIMAKFVSAAVQAGATGVGAGHGYMGPSNIHVGFGKQATWGGADWIQSAASGVFNNQDLSSEGGGYSTAGGGGSTGIPGVDGMLGGGMGGMPMMGMGLPMMPFPMMGGLGGIFGTLLGGISSLASLAPVGGSSQKNYDTAEAETEDTQPIENDKNVPSAEADDLGQELQNIVPRSLASMNKSIISGGAEPASIKRMQTAAIENDASRYQMPTTQQQQTSPNFINPQSGYQPNQDLARNGYPSQSAYSSSPSWYLQLAGRIHNDEAMKFKGGVFA